MDKCEKHDDCMESVRGGIHNNELNTAKLEGCLEGFMKSTQEYVDASRKDMYTKGGIIDSVGNNTNQLKMQWGILVLVLIAIISFSLGKG